MTIEDSDPPPERDRDEDKYHRDDFVGLLAGAWPSRDDFDDVIGRRGRIFAGLQILRGDAVVYALP